MKRGRIIVTVFITALIVVGALAIVFSRIQKTQQNGSPNAAPAQGRAPTSAVRASAVRVAPVENGVVENRILLNGDILTGREVAMYPAAAGRLSELRVKVGDRVTRGQVIAYVDPSRPGEVFAQSPVASTISGTVTSSPVSAGSTVTTSTALLTVSELSTLLVETFVPERYAGFIQNNLPALVSLEAFPDETFAARVSEVSPVLDPASRTLRIRLSFDTRDSRLKAGMFAQVSLVTQRVSDVWVLSRDALINTYGEYIVFVVDDQNTARRREVALGLEGESLVEITSGLEAGDRVVTAGQNFLTDGDPVRVVQ